MTACAQILCCLSRLGYCGCKVWWQVGCSLPGGEGSNWIPSRAMAAHALVLEGEQWKIIKNIQQFQTICAVLNLFAFMLIIHGKAGVVMMHYLLRHGDSTCWLMAQAKMGTVHGCGAWAVGAWVRWVLCMCAVGWGGWGVHGCGGCGAWVRWVHCMGAVDGCVIIVCQCTTEPTTPLPRYPLYRTMCKNTCAKCTVHHRTVCTKRTVQKKCVPNTCIGVPCHHVPNVPYHMYQTYRTKKRRTKHMYQMYQTYRTKKKVHMVWYIWYSVWYVFFGTVRLVHMVRYIWYMCLVRLFLVWYVWYIWYGAFGTCVWYAFFGYGAYVRHATVHVVCMWYMRVHWGEGGVGTSPTIVPTQAYLRQPTAPKKRTCP